MNDLPGARQADPRGNVRWRTSAIVLAACLAVCLVVAGLAWKREHDRVSAQERVALAHGLALHAAELRDADHSTARNLGLAAVKIHSDGQTRAGLIDTLAREHSSEFTLEASSEVALSGDGRIALTGHGDEVSVWDLTTWLDPKIVEKPSDRVAALKGHKENVGAVALSFDGRTVLTGDDDGTTIVWDLTDPAKPIRMAAVVNKRDAEYANSVEAVALSRDGRTAMIAGSDGDVTAWDLTDRSRPARLSMTAHASSIRDLGLSADGAIAVTVENKGTVTLWDLTAPSPPVKPADLALPAKSVAAAMSTDGRVVLVGNARQVGVWNLDDRSRPVNAAVFDVPLADMYDMALTFEGKTALLAGPSDSAILWDLSAPSRPARIAALKGYSQEINSVALSADGGIALTAGPGGVSLWNLKDLSEVVANLEYAACLGHTGAEISKADWARYAGSADWSDYGEEDWDTLAVCLIRPDST
ncbi:WD domain-containing protein, G-beta repeat-containing protein [Streptosporangium canum]|uniref:WD domain-containing protein, G-beta repeat-containing protein n=1 Tax=Streptosporangium canum TaxID=324952 RepID=A0A1I4EN24_9ACTN|nr:WD40 repeat domain-containing protein [Streptosporangium canum]SFL05876.1 WD domain-containing protein, G-beta repeat-containing protein [Streptosporangium canum]